MYFLFTHIAMPGELSVISITNFEIGDEEANFTLMIDSSTLMVTNNDLKLSSTSGSGGGLCGIPVPTSQPLGLICAGLSEGTSYKLNIDLSVSGNCFMMVIYFETPTLSPLTTGTESPSTLHVTSIHQCTCTEHIVCSHVLPVLCCTCVYACLHVCIRKYSSASYVGMGRVQNGVLYLRYGSDFVITKEEHCKAFAHKKASLFYCRKCSQASANLS